MKSIIIIVTMLLISTSVHAENEVLYNTLDSVVANRHKYTKEKEARLSMLKQRIPSITDPALKLEMYNTIYNEYHYFRYVPLYSPLWLKARVTRRQDVP